METMHTVAAYPNPHVLNNPMGPTCAFPSPRPRMVYCLPAAYQQINGQRYQPIVNAYGKARPYNP